MLLLYNGKVKLLLKTKVNKMRIIFQAFFPMTSQILYGSACR